MSARDLISGEAELDSQEEDESFDEETGEARRKVNGVNGINGRVDDSSEEEDDDDEEEARAVSRSIQFAITHWSQSTLHHLL